MWGPSTTTISKPTYVDKENGCLVEKWTQLKEMAGTEKWMAGFYGEDGGRDAILSKRIDDGASECTVAYPPTTGGNTIAIRCQW